MDIIIHMKPLKFHPDAIKSIRLFPEEARKEAGFQLDRAQRGEQPEDFKPFPTIGPGVEELRIRDTSGAFRVIYTARFPEAVYAFHAFQKKTQKTDQAEIDLAKARFKALLKDREK
jgi:phage-related protein